MKQKSIQISFAISSMVMIGSVYGWSSTADLLKSSNDWSITEAVFLFVNFAIGIGSGVAISGFLLDRLHYARTIAMGLGVWGLASLLLSQSGFQHSFHQVITSLGLLGGGGVGIAYLALVRFFRSLFDKPTVFSGLIGPLGFASGSVLLCVAQTRNVGINGVVEVYRLLGIAALALAIVVFFFLPEPSQRASIEEAGAKSWRDLISLWALLSLNVSPGMAVIAIAVPWFRNIHSWSFEEAVSALCAAFVALPLGQVIVGLCANRWGERQIFFLMFVVRLVPFSAAALSSQTIWPWLLTAIALACHGGGFGLIPKMVTKSTLGADPRLLGIVLMGWGLGGALGALAMVPATTDAHAESGYAVLAGLMLTGVIFSTKRLWPSTVGLK
jgi:MFS transporter, OFA family, oxalate/formate antiporter